MKTVTWLFFFLIGWFGTTAQDCVDSTLIDLETACFALWDPVCGCNGVTYGNECEAENWGGVTSWTSGECTGQSECLDLAGIDFGDCEAWLGFAVLDGTCTGMSGCGYVVDNVDYSPYFYETEAECGACEANCLDVGAVDFGECDFPLGIALINGTCQSISGCDWTVDGVDYSPYFYTEMQDCQACQPTAECLDLAEIDFGACTMVLGLGLINGQCQTISGCDWTIDGVDYSPYFYTDLAACQACETQSVDGPGNFGVRWFPQPATGQVLFEELPNVPSTVQWFDASGRLVRAQTLRAGQDVVDVHALPAGVYVMVLANAQFGLRSRFLKQ